MIGLTSVVGIGYDNESGCWCSCSRSVEVNLSERADY